MDDETEEYIRTCDTCEQAKESCHKACGLLQPLKVPHCRWNSISVDFIVGLPESGACFSIWVIVDLFTKVAQFIPIKPGIATMEVAGIILQSIWRLHGLPEVIFSDRDS